MMAFVKAVPMGIFLTLVVCLFMGSGGTTGGTLNITSFTVEGVKLYWSWKMFLAGTGLAFGIMFLMDN